MVNVVAEFFIKEGQVEKALKLYEELIAKTRAEAGCIKYELFQDAKFNNHLVLLEQWESEEILEAHFKTEHFTRIVPMLGTIATKEAAIHKLNKIL